jgi:hypothetical protein
MPVQLTSDKWSFTSFSASCVQCGCSSEPGDVFYSGLASADGEDQKTDDGEGRADEEQQQEQEQEDQEEDQDDNAADETAFERVDYCSECWQTVTPDLYSYWRTEVPEPEEDDQEPDRSTLAGLFRGLVQKRDRDQNTDEASTEENGQEGQGAEDQLNRGLLYLLSLMLMRKGFLALENKEAQNGQDRLELRVKGTEDETYVVHEPELDPETRERVKEKLAGLLDMERGGES